MPTKVGDWSLDVWGRGGSWEYPKNGSRRFGFLGKGRKLGIPISWEYPHRWEPESPGPGAHSQFLEGAGSALDRGHPSFPTPRVYFPSPCGRFQEKLRPCLGATVSALFPLQGGAGEASLPSQGMKSLG